MRGVILAVVACTAFWMGVGMASAPVQEPSDLPQNVEMYDDGRVTIHTDQRHLKTKNGALIVLEDE